MAERSFRREVQKLRLGEGEVFRGEGILAVTKALLQSGVSYVGGYQGAPISHLMDVLTDANDILRELGVHFEHSASEATAAATLAASVHYPLRGAVTFKSTVGTNVASDALANLASGGVTGGALIIVGEDYGEGSSIMQERSHAFAMKSQMWLLDPRPNLPSIVRAVEEGFALSEASNTPVMLELRIRACHVHGRFIARNNVRPEYTLKDAMEEPVRDVSRIVLPPASYLHEQEKIRKRWPAAQRFIQSRALNERFAESAQDFGIILQGGMYNTTVRALQLLGLSDVFGNSRVPLYVLNVTYPLVEEELLRFCAGKRAVLLIEEGQPDFIEQNLNSILRKAASETKVHGKDVLPMAGEYTATVIIQAVLQFVNWYAPRLIDRDHLPRVARPAPAKPPAIEALDRHVHPRPPSFCTGCPERPIFTAMKLVERELGPHHVSCDIGCHLFSILPPFNIGATTMGYGLGWAGAAAFQSPDSGKRTVSFMGDGGFWHNGLTSGVGNAVFNQSDSLLVVVDNSYTAATGGQDILSSQAGNPIRTTRQSLADAVRGVGVKWVRSITRTYDVVGMRDALREALTTPEKGPKVIVAHSECMLNRQRREEPQMRKLAADGRRVVRERFGVDPDTCTGDHSCIRLSGCPSLTIQPNPDPLRLDPVATVVDSCVGCGLCGEVAHAAVLCPSFYRAVVITNPSALEKLRARVRRAMIAFLQSDVGQVVNLRTDCPSVPVRTSLSLCEASAVRLPLISIAILAMGGEGGGVLADWILDLAGHSGYFAQTTSVPGVAQRTGSTIYYIEMFPESAARTAGREPVLALMPVPGEVDIVIASELMEAGRAVQRELVTPDRTTLIASTHRVYSMTERTAAGDGRVDSAALLEAAATEAKGLVHADFAEIARRNNSVISAALLGALAATGALPFRAEDFEEAVRRGGVGVEASLAAFHEGVRAARAEPPAQPEAPLPSDVPTRVEREFPPACHAVLAAGVQRLIDYQDERYAAEYLDRLAPVRDADHAGFTLLRETARYLALWMSYEDAIRVADLKVRPARLERVHREARTAPGQLLEVHDFLYPRVGELADILPAGLGRWLLQTGWARRMVERLTRKGRVVSTTSIRGYLKLWLLARARRWRRRSLRFEREQRRIAEWLALLPAAAAEDYALACEVAQCPRMVKGYGDTHLRGSRNFEKLMKTLATLRGAPDAAPRFAKLREAALADCGDML